MKFARVEAFFLIWTILLFLFAILYGVRKRRRILLHYAKGRGRMAINAEAAGDRRVVKAGLILLSIFFLIIAFTGPQYGFKWEEVEQKGVDIIVALDCSKSMLARDINPTRLERAKREILDLLAMLKGDRVGLVAFSGTAFLQCPLTMDYSGFYIFLNALTPDFLPKGGTDISGALETAVNGFEEESRAEKAVIIITDGENTGDDPADAVARAQKTGIKVFAIGVGTRGGVPFPDETGGYKKDDSGRIVVSRLHEELLQKIATDTGGIYVRSAAGDMDLKAIYENEIQGKMEATTLVMGKKKVWQDRFQWFLALAIIALIAEMSIPAIRKASVFMLAVFLVGWMMSPSPVFAQNAYDAVEKGVRAYEGQKYEEALKHFIDAQVRAPEKPEISYNMGNAYYKLGKFDEAVKSYTAALKTKDQKLKEKAYYNMGNARFRLRQLEEAVSNYQSALETDPRDLQAKENLEFAKKLMAQQQQQEQQEKQQQQEEQQQQQQKEQEEKKGEDQSGESNDKNEQEQNKGDEFRQSESGKSEKSEKSEKGGKSSRAGKIQNKAGSRNPKDRNRGIRLRECSIA